MSGLTVRGYLLLLLPQSLAIIGAASTTLLLRHHLSLPALASAMISAAGGLLAYVLYFAVFARLQLRSMVHIVLRALSSRRVGLSAVNSTTLTASDMVVKV